MISKTLLGIAVIVAVPAAIAGGYFLPHPTPDYPDPYDLPPASIVEWTDSNVEMSDDPAKPRRTLPQEPREAVNYYKI